jgi:hypothetical protein
MKWFCEWLQAWFYSSMSRGLPPQGSSNTSTHTTLGIEKQACSIAH